MKLLTAAAGSLFVLASPSARPEEATASSRAGGNPAELTQGSQTMIITRSGSQPSSQGPAEYFTGSVRVDPLFQAKDPSRGSGARVTFQPGARTAWHTHPLGQILIVTAGSGWVQQWRGEVQENRPGDGVRIPPGQKHWHGATATTARTHIPMHDQPNGKVVERIDRDGRVCDWTDGLVAASRACIYGSDLWAYKLMKPGVPPGRMGHEAIGAVEAVGSGVGTLKVGGVVVMPFASSDGACAFCHE